MREPRPRPPRARCTPSRRLRVASFAAPLHPARGTSATFVPPSSSATSVPLRTTIWPHHSLVASHALVRHVLRCMDCSIRCRRSRIRRRRSPRPRPSGRPSHRSTRLWCTMVSGQRSPRPRSDVWGRRSWCCATNDQSERRKRHECVDARWKVQRRARKERTCTCTGRKQGNIEKDATSQHVKFRRKCTRAYRVVHAPRMDAEHSGGDGMTALPVLWFEKKSCDRKRIDQLGSSNGSHQTRRNLSPFVWKGAHGKVAARVPL